MRPASIVRFEQLYLAAMAAGIVGDLLSSNDTMAALEGNPNTAAIGPGLFIGSIVLTTAAMVALWYFAARRRSVVAKWLISGWFVLSTVMMALMVFWDGLHFDVISVLLWASYLVGAWSVSYLFKPDADEWFASGK